jgi:hypothetical protein
MGNSDVLHVASVNLTTFRRNLVLRSTLQLQINLEPVSRLWPHIYIKLENADRTEKLSEIEKYNL